MSEPRREALGRVVREAWVAWARCQPDCKPSWLVPWDELDAGQREVDMLIAEAVVLSEFASQYAAQLLEERFHPPYKPARKLDLGHEQAKRARASNDEREPA